MKSHEKVRTRLAPEARKKQLLMKALDAFAIRGISRAGHADIADTANVSVATVFNYFPTREELLKNVLTTAVSELHHAINTCLIEQENPKDCLEAILTVFIDAALNEENWLKIWFEWSTSTQEDLWQDFIQQKQILLNKYTNLFARLTTQSPETQKDLALLFDAACYSLYLQSHQHPDKEALTKQAEQYIDLLVSKTT